MTAVRVRGLDGLRGCAIVLVFISHSTTFGRTYDLGAGGVWLFFVLSGFLIVGILNSSRGQGQTSSTRLKAALLDFYARRSIRIFPMYYIILIVTAIVLSTVGIAGLSWRTLGILSVYGTNFIVPYDAAWRAHFSHFWSLAVEEQFYILAAPLFLITNTKWATISCWTILGVSVLNAFRLSMGQASYAEIYADSIVNFGLIAVGGIAALSPLRAGLPGRRSWLAIAAMALYLLVPFASHSFSSTTLLRPYLTSLLALVLIVEVARNQNSTFVKIIDIAAMRKLGIISYTFYLIHPFCIIRTDAFGRSVLSGIVVPFHTPAPFAQVFEFSLCVALSVMSWEYLEKPMLAWRDRFLRPQGMESTTVEVSGAASATKRPEPSSPRAAAQGSA